MFQVEYNLSGLLKHRYSGMAGVLDGAAHGRSSPWSAAFPWENTHAFVLGGRGNTMMPLPRYSTFSSISITGTLPPDRVEATVKRTMNGGPEIVSLPKTGSAYYARSSSTPGDGGRGLALRD